MSTLDKMLIKGIRSFYPENKKVITFFRPLTLIVGGNGVGKTTIMEAVKLCCMGELPPNARAGRNFIRDPKVDGETETKAQIKLRFKTAAGNDVLCMRSFRLTQKASKMVPKAIENVLQTLHPDTGQIVSRSMRCADMDEEVPALMGVSKAILENVIFVHQDEANWPLEDSSTSKKKFDDIFFTTRYTEALEAIKKLHKEQAEDIKTYKLNLKNLKTWKDDAYKLREKLVKEKEMEVTLKNQLDDLGLEIQDVEAEISQVKMTLKSSQEFQDHKNAKNAEHSFKFQQQQDLYADLKEEIEDTEVPKEWRSKFDEETAQLETKICTLEREKNATETMSSACRDEELQFNSEINMIQAEQQAHKSWETARDSEIQNLSAKLNLNPLSQAPFSDEVASEIINRINKDWMKWRMTCQIKRYPGFLKSIEKELKEAWEQYEDVLSRLQHNKVERKKNQMELEEKRLSEAHKALKEEKKELRSQYDNLNSRLYNELEEQTQSTMSYKKDTRELSSTMIKYNKEGKEKQLKELREKLSASKSAMKRNEEKYKDISAELEKSKDLQRSRDQLKRNIEDNLKYRKVKAEVDYLTHEIKSLDELIKKSRSISAMEEELVKLSKEKERLLCESNICSGKLHVFTRNISENTVSLQQTQYEDIDNRYFDQLVQLKTTEMANRDLDRYYNALDKALMRFHNINMEDINNIIWKLWKGTYRGEDIDYIYIHADSTIAGTRSYSYKVMMQTGDTALEMRGRCSAGQKVLASLIIRLALAETFCSKCGILALDEPTTNLDNPTSDSLAAALLGIMEDRKDLKSFQLIVITHDERFARLIGQSQLAQKYYHVIKDKHGRSQIEMKED